jgi:DNA-binding PadR family transcriptional regulator
MHMGAFEELVLYIVAILNGKAYGVGIIGELEQRTGRPAAIGAVQTVLKRMEGKGWVTSAIGEATPARGGKAKRYYTITAQGQHALIRNRELRERLWHAIPKTGWSYEPA